MRLKRCCAIRKNKQNRVLEVCVVWRSPNTLKGNVMRSVISEERRRQRHETLDSVLNAMPVKVDDFEEAERAFSEG